MFKIKTRYYLKLSTSEKMTLLGNKDKNDENFPHLEITEVVLIHCNIVNNDYQQDLKVLNKFGLNKSSGQLLGISPTNFYIFQNL